MKFLPIVFLSLLSIIGYGQKRNKLEGVVMGKNDNVIEGAFVSVVGGDSYNTKKNGSYIISLTFEPGAEVTIVVQKDGYESYVKKYTVTNKPVDNLIIELKELNTNPPSKNPFPDSLKLKCDQLKDTILALNNQITEADSILFELQKKNNIVNESIHKYRLKEKWKYKAKLTLITIVSIILLSGILIVK